MAIRAYVSQGDGEPVAVQYVLDRQTNRGLRSDVTGRLILDRAINTGTCSLMEEGVSRAIHVLDCQVEVDRSGISFTAPFAAVDATEWTTPVKESPQMTLAQKPTAGRR